MAGDSPSKGVTPSEKYLGELCRKSFLTLWSYQNVFTDRGVNARNKQGKELCDVVVVFEDNIVLFSDKSCAMPNTGDVVLDWSRWYRKAIADSARQIFGAERWLDRYPERIFTDRYCQNKFPILLPTGPNKKIHRIVVALGSSKRAEKFFGGNSRGSLMLASWLHGTDHATPSEHFLPFTFGWADDSRRFVHVMDDVTLDLVMGELDTISDFVQYLSAKEQFFNLPNRILCAGEKEFLGFYLENLDKNGNFVPAEIKAAMNDPLLFVHIAEGIWDEFSAGEFHPMWKQLRQNGKFTTA